ncbi:MAG: 2OG-Fe(II) oxygenase [Pseudomonadales bacterium]|nr:2OG-Fe(II) oxygenase [Pseudomonadales bacterium]MCP5330527.1 2OG-Fe(II) oxygenase [Pseudomonadales bacterium]MCP5344855.1 2OG-Fe(II) oxygenase [Pseudomonadales bacterium]
MQLAFSPQHGDHDGDDPLFLQIAQDLREQGWSVIPNALPVTLAEGLHSQILGMGEEQFSPAGVGRSTDFTLNPFVRRDEILWIEGRTQAEKDWLQWSNRLRLTLNRRLFLGLFSFESHFAHYPPGAFYRKHVDAFRGNPGKDPTNRVLSVVAYFNPGWLPEDGGELDMYREDELEPFLRVTPAFGTLVVFLSEELPHEVRAANRHRYSIAGWYRVNNSLGSQIDPPR